MQKIIFNTDTVIIHYDESQDYMLIIWKKNCGNILNYKYSGEIADLSEVIKAKAPKKLMVDMAACTYSITSESGPWYENTLFSMYGELPHGKVAIILPNNLFVHAFFDAVSAHEKLDFNTNIQYFRDAGTAGDWLNE